MKIPQHKTKQGLERRIAIEQARRAPDAIRRAMQSRGGDDPVNEPWNWTPADEIRNRRNQVNREIGHPRFRGGGVLSQE